MLKIRLQGTTNDIKWFKKILERETKGLLFWKFHNHFRIRERKNIFVCMQR